MNTDNNQPTRRATMTDRTDQACTQCGSGPLTGRQRRFCSQRCRSRYHNGYKGTFAASQEDRFWSNVEAVGDCWIWTSAKDHQGYGLAWWDRVRVRAHRKSYELMVGPIPEGLVIDHLCRTPDCVNPSNMEPVTIRENTLRGRAGTKAAARNLAKTHCPQGHPYDEENTYRNGNRRQCRTCGRLRSARAYAAKKDRRLA